MTQRRFSRYAWALVAYTLLVILFGVVVRATGSGAGCGSHWPTCNGEVLPTLASAETLIEFTHRLTSGLIGLLAIALVVWAFRAFPKGSPVRWGAVATLVLTIVEGLIGAALVRMELVADNASAARAAWIAGHLVNTFLLFGALGLTAWWGSGGKPPRLRGQGSLLGWLGAGVVAMLLLGMSGAVTALGDTLFPAASLAEGLRQDLSPGAHFLVQLRILHPLLAILTGLYLLFAARVVSAMRPGPTAERLARGVTWLYVIQIGAGALNVVLLAPLAMQLLHLLLADLLWLLFILLGATTLAEEPAPQPQAEPLRSLPTGG